MLRWTLLAAWMVLLSISMNGQNRSIDGTNNNLNHPEWGSAHSRLTQLTDVGFRDGISRPAGLTRPNPRWISNELFAQDSLKQDVLSLSDFCWVWGQFIDHDITLVPNDPNERASIAVNFQDDYFNPSGNFTVFLPLNRSLPMPGSGTDVNNPRTFPNIITAFIDGSGVYGSEEERAEWLRTHQGGKLRTSEGDLLPYNTVDGEFDSEIDHDAPEMDNENPFVTKYFVAGDVRANENPLLASFHTLFVREHNRLCDELALEHPDWDDEELYQYARKLVGGKIAAITYEEWLPAMGVAVAPYDSYDPEVNPGISNVFSAAAFRMGHTLLSSELKRLDNNGDPIDQGHISLKDAFFNPSALPDVGGLDPYFKGMASQAQQDLDSKVVDDIRNFLFGPPGSSVGGLDLASINIQRGRERGLTDFNTIRMNYGLPPYTNCWDINNDSEVWEKLESLYTDINDIDPWVGMLAESHMQDALFGETIMAIMKQQFEDVRDGDRFYYEIDPVLSSEDKTLIKTTKLRDVIMANTNIDIMQDNVFHAMPHDSVCSAPSSRMELVGAVRMPNGQNVSDVELYLSGYASSNTASLTDQDGIYRFTDLLACESYEISPLKNDDFDNGVNTYDLVLLSQHLRGLRSIDNPYSLLAADVNRSGSITAFDMVEIRKLLLRYSDSFTSNTAWRFVDESFAFTDETNPFLDTLTESITIASLEDASAQSFIAIKTGDIDNSADVNATSGSVSSTRSGQAPMEIKIEDRWIQPDQMVLLDFYAPEMPQFEGFQFTLEFDKDALQLEGIVEGALPGLSAANFNAQPGKIISSWNASGPQEFEWSNGPLFSLKMTVNDAVRISEAFKISSDLLDAEAYDLELGVVDVNLSFNKADAELIASQFDLLQNRPNPASDKTTIGFIMPEGGTARLAITDLAGRIVYTSNGTYSKGYQSITISKSDLPVSGVLIYTMETDFGKATRKMIIE